MIVMIMSLASPLNKFFFFAFHPQYLRTYPIIHIFLFSWNKSLLFVVEEEVCIWIFILILQENIILAITEYPRIEVLKAQLFNFNFKLL